MKGSILESPFKLLPSLCSSRTSSTGLYKYHAITIHLDSPNLDLEPRAWVADDKELYLQKGSVLIFGLSTARAVEKLQGGMTVLQNAWDTVLHGKNPEFLLTPWSNLWILGVCFIF